MCLCDQTRVRAGAGVGWQEATSVVLARHALTEATTLGDTLGSDS